MEHACEVAFPSNRGTRRGTISAKERCYVFPFSFFLFFFLSFFLSFFLFLLFSGKLRERKRERVREGERGEERRQKSWKRDHERASVSDAVDRDDDNASLRGPRFFTADARLLCVSPGHAQRFLRPLLSRPLLSNVVTRSPVKNGGDKRSDTYLDTSLYRRIPY